MSLAEQESEPMRVSDLQYTGKAKKTGVAFYAQAEREIQDLHWNWAHIFWNLQCIFMELYFSASDVTSFDCNHICGNSASVTLHRAVCTVQQKQQFQLWRYHHDSSKAFTETATQLLHSPEPPDRSQALPNSFPISSTNQDRQVTRYTLSKSHSHCTQCLFNCGVGQRSKRIGIVSAGLKLKSCSSSWSICKQLFKPLTLPQWRK